MGAKSEASVSGEEDEVGLEEELGEELVGEELVEEVVEAVRRSCLLSRRSCLLCFLRSRLDVVCVPDVLDEEVVALWYLLLGK